MRPNVQDLEECVWEGDVKSTGVRNGEETLSTTKYFCIKIALHKDDLLDPNCPTTVPESFLLVRIVSHIYVCPSVTSLQKESTQWAGTFWGSNVDSPRLYDGRPHVYILCNPNLFDKISLNNLVDLNLYITYQPFSIEIPDGSLESRFLGRVF